ncbi:MAG: polysaccharide biosynthesis C-terminal domain-containing protein [Lachnospiraceae bacterium]
MGKYKYLANHIALFSISNFVSKILVFLLVPFYTNVLTTQEYGVADIFQVTILLLVPALTVNMGEAALRYGIEREEKRGSILRIGLKYTAAGGIFVALAAFISAFFVSGQMKWYLFLFVLLFITDAFYEYLVLYFQGCEFVTIVVAGSVLSTLIMLLSNLFFLLVLKIGLNGYLFSQMLAYTAAVCLMLLLGRRHTRGSFHKDQVLEKEMLSYGKPLLLYSTGSWINNAADRYILAALCGTAVNGLYGVAYKIPAILMVFQRIFAQAWQMSATKSYADKNSNEFFSTMYQAYHTFMVIGCSALILCVRLLAWLLFKKDFYEAWQYVPPLLISVIFGALTGFLGSICLAHKDSRSMGFATGAGALLNIVLNFLLVPHLGAMGSAAATAVSYFTMYFMALLIVRKYVTIRTNLVRDYLSYLLLVLQSVVMIRSLGPVYAVSGLITLLLVILYRKEVTDMINKVLSLLKKSEEH